MTGAQSRCPVCRRRLSGDVWAFVRPRPFARINLAGQVVQRGMENVVVLYCDEHVPAVAA